MRKFAIAGVFLAASAYAAAAQTSAPSTENRANVAAATHCKEKDGTVRLKSSAPASASTATRPATTGAASAADEFASAPPATVGGQPAGSRSDMSEVARTLPDCS